MKDNMLKNAAYSDQYLKENQKYEALFAEENKTKTEEIVLSDIYQIIETTYKGKVQNCNLHGNSCVLLNESAEVIHTWRCFNDDAEFHTLIMHQDGSQYLVYRQELYGYTVFNLKNRKEFQYYPQCVLDGKEYFIWTGVDYNPTNNLLAVTGCIWGAPWSTLLVDFESPMAEPKFQIDIIDCLPGSYDVYDDANFVRWDDQNIVLNCYNTKINSKEEVTISPDIYRQEMNLSR